MRLKSIKLAGFKSFVDATSVPFPTNMTAIVGPNGCGKSNIIDAVRWVMGESSAKNLRGESMTDVIFNGSTGRQPVGQASIELIFDNSEGKLEGEHGAFAEISIKRKVTREGLSQYYLNGTKCRRRDVTDIFLGTGMGPRSYAIIEQGMIARLIESKPEELRVYLEEAAGISKYKERRRDTENRMRRTQENLDRLSDIREELDKQLQHLRRQANAAEKYAEYKKSERSETARLNAYKWRALEVQRTGLVELTGNLESRIEEAVIDKTTHESQIEAARTELEERQEVFNRVQAKYYESGAEIAKLEQQLKFQREQLLRQDQELAQIQEERARLREQQSLDAEKQEILQMDIEAVEPELETCRESLEQYRESLVDREEALAAWQEEWDRYNQQTAQARQSAEVQQARIQTAENQLRQLSDRKQRLDEETDQLRAQLEEQQSEHVGSDAARLEEQVRRIDDDVDMQRAQLKEWRQKLEELNRERGSVEKQSAEQRAVLASLKTLQEAALADDDSRQTLQSMGLEHNAPWMASVKVEQGWELAFEHAVQPWIKGISCKQPGDLFKGLRTQHSITLIDSEAGVSSAPKAGTLASVVSGAEALQSWFESIRLVADCEEALSRQSELLPGESFICQDGTWVARNWMRTHGRAAGSSGVVERGAKIEELEAILPGLEDRLAGIEADRESQREAILVLEQELTDKEKSLTAMSRELAAVHAQEKVIRAKSEQLELRIKRNETEIAEITANYTHEEEQLAIARESWQEAMLSLESLVDERSEQQDKKESLQRAVEEVRQQAESRQHQFHSLQLRYQQLRNELDQLTQNLQRLQETLAQIGQREQQLHCNEHLSEQDLSDEALRLEGMLEARLQDEEKLSLARRDMEQVTLSLRTIEGERGNKETRLQTLRSELEKARMELQAVVMRQAGLLEQIEKDEFDLQATLASLTDEDDETSLEQSLTSLASRIQRLGPINLAAIDEFKEQSERKDYLDSQHEDLMEALETLATAIRKIDKETRARFKETYDQVNEGLQRLFPKIFGGGSAHLELTDDDLLETGVSIIARPPGKKNSTIHLLSGGEKALTAIALIFAIFELNPALFCMLDEVDAPLDDANVGRFANMVKEMSKQVQFIYISHNKVSMEKADQLMGVTMHEPGVSRLVSVDVEEAAALAEM